MTFSIRLALILSNLALAATGLQACSGSTKLGKKELSQVTPVNEPLQSANASKGSFLTLAFESGLIAKPKQENSAAPKANPSPLHDNLIIKIFDAKQGEVQSPGKTINTSQFEPIILRRNKELTAGDVITVPGVPRLSGIKASISFLSQDEEVAFCESKVLDLQSARTESVKVPMQCVLRKNPEATVAVIEPQIVVNTAVELGLMPEEKESIERLIDKIQASGILLTSDVQFAAQKARLLLRILEGGQGLYKVRFEILETPSGVSLATAETTLGKAELLELFKSKGRLNFTASWLTPTQNGDAVSLESRMANLALETQNLFEIANRNQSQSEAQVQSAYALVAHLKASDAKTGLELLGGTATINGGLELTFFSDVFEKEENAAAAYLRVASYNVENFWDDNPDNSAAALTYDDFSATSSDYISEAAFLTKAKHIVKALSLAGFPDVIGMQELESAENQSRSLELLKPLLEERGYRYFALGKQTAGKPVSVTTGFVSRYPIVLNESLVLDFVPEGIDEKTKADLKLSARDPQVVEIEISHAAPAGEKGTQNSLANVGKETGTELNEVKTRVRIYNSHWKSKRGDTATGEAMRLATARLIKSDIEKVRAERPNLDIIVMGDLNTDYRETQILEAGLGQTGDKRKMIQEERSDRLYNLWFDLKESDRCSYSHSGLRGCIDNMFLSDSLYDRQGLQVVDGSFRIIGRDKGLRTDNSAAVKGGFAEQILLGADGTPFSWQIKTIFRNDGTKRMLHVGQGYSDHLPIVVDFKVTKQGLPGKLSVDELNSASFSTTDSPPQNDLPERVAACGQGEYTDIDAQNPTSSFDFGLPQNAGKCVRLVSSATNHTATQSNGKTFGTLERDGLFGVRVRLANGSAIGLTMTNSYDKNQTFLRGNIQNAIGDSLVLFQGRLGWAEGTLSLFAADQASDVKLKNFEEPCDTPDKASLNLPEVLSQLANSGKNYPAGNQVSLKDFHGKCVSFENVEIEVERETKAQTAPLNPAHGAVQGPRKAIRIGTLTSADQISGALPKIGLFLAEEQALAGLAQKGSYLISGFGTLIVTAGRQGATAEFILNTLTNGRSTGQIISATQKPKQN